MVKSISNMRLLDELADQSSPVHDLHPLIKLLTAVAFIVTVVSFDKYDFPRLFPLVLYPVLLTVLGDLPVKPLAKRALIVSPLIIGIGIFNPIFDSQPYLVLGGLQISGGWISFLSIVLKGSLTIFAALILISTTGMTRIAAALAMLKVPRLLILQLLLTYRYIAVLFEEVFRTVNAYSLRSGGQKGIKYAHWGSLMGQLLLRTLDRAQRIYHAMCCRGFKGEYETGERFRVKAGDYVFLLSWCAYFILIRLYDIPHELGILLMGVV